MNLTVPRPPVKDFQAEAEVLLGCLRTRIPPDLTERIRFLVRQDMNWEYLLSMAAKHRVMPLLFHGLLAVCPEVIPSAVRLTMEQRLEKNARTNQILTDALLRLLPLFQAAGIPVIPYKGTVLAVSVYGDMNLRQVWDIDLLIGEPRLADSRKLLLSQGYAPTKAFDRAQNFVHFESKIEIDLHWGLTPLYFPIDLDFEYLWSRTERVLLEGIPIPSFRAEDLLQILCLQVAKDCWERRQHLEYLAKVADIAELLRASPGLDWAETIARARQQGSLRILHFGLFLTKCLLEVEIPNTVWYWVKADSLAVSLASQVCYQLFGDNDRAAPKPHDSSFDFSFRIRQLWFYLKMRERPVDWLRHFLEIGRSGLPLLICGRARVSAP